MKPKYLWHGSSKKLKGDKLVPNKPGCLSGKKENIHTGVYANDNKMEAILMGAVSGEGVNGSGLRISKRNVFGIVYEGWPRNKYFYLYTLLSANFENCPKGSSQWISFEPSKPVKIEKLKVKDYIHLIRRPTPSEGKKWKERIKQLDKKQK